MLSKDRIKIIPTEIYRNNSKFEMVKLKNKRKKNCGEGNKFKRIIFEEFIKRGDKNEY